MQTTDISTSAQTEIAAATTTEASASGSSDFETFLTLLTAQMRNQDPMQPMDSTQFVAQLASFSSVEQQIETNTKLGELLELFGGSPTANLTEWLGKEVRREGVASFDGRPVEIDATVHESADAARLVVRDENDMTIYTQQFDPASDAVTWNGNTFEATVALTGRYSFEIESFSGGSLLETTLGSVFDLVTEVRLESGNTVLMFEDGAALHAEEATAVRIP
ncbi:hypothetical protein A9Q96_11040 [Rhodobacterales bacterium 52_120_T64]|nr:hypothetical protein A9Q96_11040 [Rhodobacterales bacterium 52_120_T64]